MNGMRSSYDNLTIFLKPCKSHILKYKLNQGRSCHYIYKNAQFNCDGEMQNITTMNTILYALSLVLQFERIKNWQIKYSGIL